MGGIGVGLLVVTLAAAGTPKPGTYRVTRDRITETKEVWGLYCRGDRVSSTTGTKLELTVNGKEWTAQGGSRRFGTAVCEGRNKTLKAYSRKLTGATRG